MPTAPELMSATITPNSETIERAIVDTLAGGIALTNGAGTTGLPTYGIETAGAASTIGHTALSIGVTIAISTHTAGLPTHGIETAGAASTIGNTALSFGVTIALSTQPAGFPTYGIETTGAASTIGHALKHALSHQIAGSLGTVAARNAAH